MTSEQEKELLDYLATLGFKGEELSLQVHEQQERSLPNFRVQLNHNHGEELMIYDLHFRRDAQFNSYRLEEYEATHRMPVKIAQQVINGIDTEQLSLAMNEIDWLRYFDKGRPSLNLLQLARVDDIMDKLLQLEANDHANGWEVQKKLQYKYWPEHAYDKSVLYFRNELEHTRTFMPHEDGMCNANLAYYIVSGRLDALYEKLSTVELDKYSGRDLYIELERQLSRNPDGFELKFYHNDSEAYSEIIVTIAKTGNDYSSDNYNASVIAYPDIAHGIYNGIDSAILEEMMREIDWHNDNQLYIFHEDAEPEFKPRVADIQEQMYRLSLDKAGSEIEDLLQLKYWADADFFEGVIKQTAWDHLNELPKKEQEFPLEMNAQMAVNLLKGRCVLSIPISEIKDDNLEWMKLDIAHKNDEGKYPVIRIAGFNKSDMEQQLSLLPIVEPFHEIRNSLLKGDRVAATLNEGRAIYIQADPEGKTLNVYTERMKQIPVNLRLDPDWIQPVINTSQQENKKTPTATWYKTTKPFKKNKGKGL
jgi:hypothetical protein